MEELAPRELVANQYPGDEEAEHCVEKCCCKREAEAYPQRRQHARIAENIPQARGAERRRAQDQDREGKKDDEAEIGQRIGERDGKPRNCACAPKTRAPRVHFVVHQDRSDIHP